jgi:hypothetical protein
MKMRKIKPKYEFTKLYYLSIIISSYVFIVMLNSCSNPTGPGKNNLIFSADTLSLWTPQIGSNLNLNNNVAFYTDTSATMEIIFYANSNMHNANDIGTAAFNTIGLSCKDMNGQLDTLFYHNQYTYNYFNINISQTTENGWKFIQLKNVRVYQLQ